MRISSINDLIAKVEAWLGSEGNTEMAEKIARRLEDLAYDAGHSYWTDWTEFLAQYDDETVWLALLDEVLE